MSPRQISFLTSHAEDAWSAQEQRHFDGKPFEAQVASAMPFYGATAGEEARLRASAEAKAAAPKRRRKHRPDVLRFLGQSDPGAVAASGSAAPVSASSLSDASADASARPDDSESDTPTSPGTSESGSVYAGSPTPQTTPTSGDAVSPQLSRPLADAHIPNRHSKSTKPHRKYKSYSYGTPEMPRGNANLPHRPASALNARVAPGHVQHLPRAEKLPLTGYELLAAQLSSHGTPCRRGSIGSRGSRDSGDSRDSRDTESHRDRESAGIKPLYRKFEALNHRILLHLQDELSELEEQLHRLDTADTQTRRLQSHILPASRRAEASAGGELQWHKTDTLGKIGYKLGQYNHVLSSFTETQQLAPPTLSDVRSYRTYLDMQQPIAEIETRFLDASDDLVTLATTHRRTAVAGVAGVAVTAAAESSGSEASFSPYMHTQRGPGSGFLSCPSPLSDALPARFAPPPRAVSENGQAARAVSRDAPLRLYLCMAVAVLVPVLAFSVIPTFAGRMAVVVLAASAVFGVQVQAATAPKVHARQPGERSCSPSSPCCPSSLSTQDTRHLIYGAAIYGAVLSTVASICA